MQTQVSYSIQIKDDQVYALLSVQILGLNLYYFGNTDIMFNYLVHVKCLNRPALILYNVFQSMAIKLKSLFIVVLANVWHCCYSQEREMGRSRYGYPDPMVDFASCNRNSKSFVCDPDRLIAAFEGYLCCYIIILSYILSNLLPLLKVAFVLCFAFASLVFE